MKYFSMFSGIGGFELGIEKAYSKNQPALGSERSEPAPQHCGRPFCVGFSEIDKYATAIYQFHYPDHKNFGDAFKIDPGTISDFDLLCGGFPCQAFSVAGKRGGFDDIRGTLFFEITRVLSVKRPKFLLLENVKGLLSHDNGRTFGTILSTLSDLGYVLEWQVLNSKDFGVPQNRERVFIVGHLGGICGGQVFPITENSGSSDIRIVGTTKGKNCTRFGERDQVYSGEGIMGCLKSSDYKQPPQIFQLNNPTHSNDRVYAEKGLSPALNTMQGGNRQPKVMRQPLRFLDRNQKNIEGDYAFTVDSSNTSGVKVDQRIRRLTPTECERLQAFPDGYTKYGLFVAEVKEISDSQRYKVLGNSVTVNVIEAIARKMFVDPTSKAEG